MSSFLIPERELTEDDLARRKEYYRARNLYVKYSLEELQDFLKIDLYEALDLDFLKFKSIPPEMLEYTAKRKLAIYHPVKNEGKSEAFILISRASEIFSNRHYKAVYDSRILDESIPEDREYSLEEFISTFDPVFRRNGMFSETQPVPSISKNVDEFYAFWKHFKTTRVYDDPADVFGQSNSNRKYYTEMNREKAQKRRNADILRLRELVSLAYRRDPRIKRVVRAESSAPWKDSELKSLRRLDALLGKSKNRYAEIAAKLNSIALSKRTPEEVRAKLESLRRK